MAVGAVYTSVRGPGSPLSLLNIGEMAPADAPPAISVQGEDYCEEDKDWGAKCRRLMVGSSGRVKGVMGMMGRFMQSARPIWHARRSVRHSIRRHSYGDEKRREESKLSGGGYAINKTG